MGKGLMLFRGDGLSWLPRPTGIGLGSCKSCRLHANAGGQLYGVGGSPSCHPLPGHGLRGMARCSQHRGGPRREGRELRGFGPSKHLPAKGDVCTGWLPWHRPRGRSLLAPVVPWLCRDIPFSPHPSPWEAVW